MVTNKHIKTNLLKWISFRKLVHIRLLVTVLN